MPKRQRLLDDNPIYYVYVLFDWLGNPFYVGKGHGNRIKSHEKSSDPRNELKNEIIEQTWIMLEEIPKIIVRDQLPEGISYEIEIALISAIGRLDLGTGPLTNLTAGGEGCRIPTEQRSLASARGNKARLKTLGKDGLSALAAKINETLGPKGRRNRSLKSAETLGFEGRCARAKRARETLGPEGRRALALKANETVGIEGKKTRILKMNKNLGPEGRRARSIKSNESCGREGCRARLIKGNETLGPEGRRIRSLRSAETRRVNFQRFQIFLFNIILLWSFLHDRYRTSCQTST